MNSFNRVSIAIMVLLGNVVIMIVGIIFNTVPLQMAVGIIVSNTAAIVVMVSMEV